MPCFSISFPTIFLMNKSSKLTGLLKTLKIYCSWALKNVWDFPCNFIVLIIKILVILFFTSVGGKITAEKHNLKD